MRRSLWIAAALVAAAAAFSSCFSMPTTPCAFVCGSGGVCPEDYQCGGDNRCHLVLDDGELAVCTDSIGTPDGMTGLDAGMDAP